MIKYIPNFISEPNVFLEKLFELEWIRQEKLPRSEYYCNDFGHPYTYGEKFPRTYNSQPYTPAIIDIRHACQKECNTLFEVVFLNRYHDQSDNLGFHADDSPEMDDERPIAIVSLGVEREIWFCPKEDRTDITKLKLGNGSLCVMPPHFQETHLHRIPKASFMCGERISLTFRGYNGV